MRQRCSDCFKVLDSCYCHTIKFYENSKHIIILMHDSEKGHALGTAQMAKLTFKSIDLLVGEDFNKNEELKSMIASNKCALLKPSTEAALYEESYQDFDTLILIDGTWKKANKIYFMNHFLHALPHVTFRPGAPSRYKLRREPKEHYLSTFESIIKSFEISEQSDLSHYLAPLDFIQEFQMQKRKES